MSGDQGNGATPRGGDHGFLAELARAVTARVEELRAINPQTPDPAFIDRTKVVHEWPDLTAYVIEELR